MIPNILIHWGAHEYVQKVQSHNEQFGNHVVLLDDKEHKGLSDGCDDFLKVYKHMTTPTKESHIYESNCFLRWFMLRNYMEQENLDVAFYCDSDVKLFIKLDDFFGQPKTSCVSASDDSMNTGYRYAASGHNSLWLKKDIELLCEFLMYTYTDNLSVLEDKYKLGGAEHSQGWRISDMTLIFLFYKQYNLDSLLKVKNGVCFDDNYNTGTNYYLDEYEMDNSGKKITWKEGIPYCYNLIEQKLCRFASLHYQETAKTLI